MEPPEHRDDFYTFPNARCQLPTMPFDRRSRETGYLPVRDHHRIPYLIANGRKTGPENQNRTRNPRQPLTQVRNSFLECLLSRVSHAVDGEPGTWSDRSGLFNTGTAGRGQCFMRAAIGSGPGITPSGSPPPVLQPDWSRSCSETRAVPADLRPGGGIAARSKEATESHRLSIRVAG